MVIQRPASPFIGSEAVAAGTLRPHQLRSRYRAVLPDVYAPRGTVLTQRERTEAAWLWSHRNGVIAGLTAAALHGSKWVDRELPVELVWPNLRPPRGVRTYDVRLDPGEQITVAGMPVTTPQRTAYDIGRRCQLDQAIVHLDALMNVTRVSVDEICATAEQHPGARGLRQLETVLGLVDAGSESPKETWLRLLLMRAGLPRPTTQIPVTTDAGKRYYLDMGWEELMVAAEYDGEHHRTDRWRHNNDNHRREDLEVIGWLVIRATVADRPDDIVARVRSAWEFRASTLR